MFLSQASDTRNSRKGENTDKVGLKTPQQITTKSRAEDKTRENDRRK
jgi:hypothetical protein